MVRWEDDAASSTLFSFIVATSIFALAFASVSYYASDMIAENQGDGESLDAIAAAALAALAGSPGAPTTWEETAQGDPAYTPDRLGLLQAGSETTMDGGKIATLVGWRGQDEKYLAARDSLGLEDYQVRIRSFPVFEATSQGVTGLAEQQVAYLGATSGLDIAEETAPLDATGVDFAPATADTDLTLGYSAGDVFLDDHASLNAHLVPRLHGFLAAHDGDQVAGVDTYWKVVDLDTYGGPDAVMDGDATRVLTIAAKSGGAWAYGSSRSLLQQTTPLDRLLLTEVDMTDAEGGDSVTIEITDWIDGYTSVPLANSLTDDYGLVEFYCTEGCIPASWQPAVQVFDDPAASKADFATRSLDVTDLVTGKKGYLALSWYSYDDGNAGQGWFIRDLKITTVSDGVTTVWENDLDFATSRYDTLVVGSHVEQANLASASDPVFDAALKGWIKAGGDLLVTGSDHPDEAWLDALSAGVTATPVTGGALYEDHTDATHAILTNPYNLHWGSYEPALNFYEPATNAFSKVVQRDVENVRETYLSVSSDAWAQEYEGVAVITAFKPYAMGPVEASRFYANAFVFQHFNDLELDFGGTVPSGVDVGTAQRSVVIDARGSGLEWLEGRIVVHVWR